MPIYFPAPPRLYCGGTFNCAILEGYLPLWLSNSSLTVFESQFVVIESQSTTGIREMYSALQEPFRSLRDVLAPKYLRCRGPHIFAPDLVYNRILQTFIDTITECAPKC